MMLAFIHDLLNPLNWPKMVGEWLVDGATDLVLSPVVAAIEWLLEAVFGALSDMAVWILRFVWDAAEPDVGAGWFAGGEGTPFGQMALLAAPLLLAFLLAGVIGGALRGDAAGMLRMAVVRLPGAVLGMTVVVAITDVLIKATDEMSAAVLAPFRDDVEQVAPMLASLVAVTGLAPGGKLLLIVFGALGLLAAIAVVVMLFIRAALIYLVVALSPLIFAASVWESMRGGVRRMAELGFALILAKLAIAAALGLSSSALVAALPDWNPTAIPAPEQADDMSVAQSLGLVVGASVMFLVAAFMPFVVYRLVPLTEAALVEQGIASGPLRAAQTAAAFGGGLVLGGRSPATAAVRARSSGGGGGSLGGGGAAGPSMPPPGGDRSDGGGGVARRTPRRPSGGGTGGRPEGAAETRSSPAIGSGDRQPDAGVGPSPGQRSQASTDGPSVDKTTHRGSARPASQPVGRDRGIASPRGEPAGGPAPRDRGDEAATLAPRYSWHGATPHAHTVRRAQPASPSRPPTGRPGLATPRTRGGGER